MKKLAVTTVVVLLAVTATACGTSTTPQTVFGEQIDRSTFKGRRPVLPSSGMLACDSAKGAGAVTFTPSLSNTTYAVNGTAVDWGKKMGSQMRKKLQRVLDPTEDVNEWNHRVFGLYNGTDNSRVRDECLNVNTVWSLTRARVVISD
jgi:hypothetical protein